MPQYKATDPATGRTFMLVGDTPPTERDLDEIFAKAPKTEAPAATPEPGFVDRMLADNPAAPLLHRGGLAVLRLAKAHPVEAGAMVGGALAAPLTGAASIPAAMAAAGLGGAGGAGLGIASRQLSTGRPEPAMDTAKTMALQGGLQAAGEGGGRVLAATANKVIPAVLKGIVRPGKNVQQEFPDVIATMRAERIPVGQSAEAGVRMKASAAEAKRLVSDAEQAGASPVQTKELLPSLKGVQETIAKRTQLGMANELPALEARAKALYRANKGGIPLTRAQELKSEAQNVASKTFRALDRGNLVNDTGAQTDKALAQGLRQAIEARVSGVKPVNTRTQSLMGLEGALEDAEARNGGIVGLNPINWLGSLMPGTASRGAFAVDAGARAANAPTAQALRQALLAILAGNGASGKE